LIKTGSLMTTVSPKVGRFTVNVLPYRLPIAATARWRAMRNAMHMTAFGIRGLGGSRTGSVVASPMSSPPWWYSKVPITVRQRTADDNPLAHVPNSGWRFWPRELDRNAAS
jgi:hypothetical protein